MVALPLPPTGAPEGLVGERPIMVDFPVLAAAALPAGGKLLPLVTGPRPIEVALPGGIDEEPGRGTPGRGGTEMLVMPGGRLALGRVGASPTLMGTEPRPS